MPDAPEETLAPTRSVLVVCAHPDDESFGLGAAVSHLTAHGASVAVLCFTRGEASTLHQSAEELRTVRSAEMHAAALALGVDDVVLLDHPDGRLADVPLHVLVAEVASAVERHSPDLVLVFDEDGVTGHPDHRRATEAAMAGAPALPVLAWTIRRSVADTLNTEFGTTFVGRDDTEVDVVLHVGRDAQRRAIGAHVSQCTDNPVLWRRLELLADEEVFRWLQRPSPTPEDAAGPIDGVAAEWNARYAAEPQLFRSDADATLVELVAGLQPGAALDLGAGEGRNSLFLAARRWDVTAVDVSSVALERLRRTAASRGLEVRTVEGDVFAYLERASGERPRFDLVVVAFVHPPAADRSRLLRAAAAEVAPGGHLFVVAHHLASLGRTGPPDPERLYVEADLTDATDGLDVLRLERRNGPSDVPDPGVDVVLWARRPPVATSPTTDR